MGILDKTGLSRVVDQIYSMFAMKNHKHSKSDISDFPSSMPASDVYGWAKEKTKPVYTASEVGAASSSHTHTTVNGHTVNSDVPNGAKFTDTNTWRPLGTTADTACAGNDSRLSNARPASDVSAWAKASTKPSYTASEVGATPIPIEVSQTDYDKLTPTKNQVYLIKG